MRLNKLWKRFLAVTLSAVLALGMPVAAGPKKAEAEAVPEPILKINFDDGSEGSGNYTEGARTYTLTNAKIVSDPEASNVGNKVFYNGGDGGTGFLKLTNAFSGESFEKGISVNMKVRPETQADDWNFLYGIGYQWQVVDGTIGFITREWTTNHFADYFPNDGFVPDNPVESKFNYFLQEENCNTWKNMTFVYSPDGKFSIYVDGSLTVQWAADDGYNPIFNELDGSLASFYLGGNIFTEGDDPTDKKRCNAYYDDVSIYKEALSAEQVYQLATGEKAVEADRSALNSALEKAAKIRTELYTEDSLNSFNTALAAANQANNNMKADQDTITSAAESLENAITSLVKKSVDLENGLKLDVDFTTDTSTIDIQKKTVTSNGYVVTPLGTSTIENGYIQSSETGEGGEAGIF